MLETKRLKLYPASREQMVACITAETDPSNIASRRVPEKSGFLPTGETGEEGPLFARRKT